MEKIVIVNLAGGLGNQIFLFEAARFIASINNSRILVNKTDIDKYHSAGKSTIEDFVFPNDIKFFKFSPWINKMYIRFQVLLEKFNNHNCNNVYDYLWSKMVLGKKIKVYVIPFLETSQVKNK